LRKEPSSEDSLQYHLKWSSRVIFNVFDCFFQLFVVFLDLDVNFKSCSYGFNLVNFENLIVFFSTLNGSEAIALFSSNTMCTAARASYTANQSASDDGNLAAEASETSANGEVETNDANL
jgi:hypothetical protein